MEEILINVRHKKHNFESKVNGEKLIEMHDGERWKLKNIEILNVKKDIKNLPSRTHDALKDEHAHHTNCPLTNKDEVKNDIN